MQMLAHAVFEQPVQTQCSAMRWMPSAVLTVEQTLVLVTTFAFCLCVL